MTIDLSSMITETRNPASVEIDQLPTLEMLRVINQEDQQVALAVSQLLPEITRAVDAIAAAFGKGGRLVYIGAGTSGRLGILDASECPPTYGVSAEQVVGLIAGGHKAILQAVENAEDDAELGAQDLKNIQFCANDVLVGIAASGRTPTYWVPWPTPERWAPRSAASAATPAARWPRHDISMVAVVGPEIVTGSSRMKAGTAQKLILNMLSTGAMIRTGKVYGNLMVDVEATNAKLVERQKRIVMEATDCERAVAERALAQADNHCKTAIVMILAGLTTDEARTRLQSSNGFISQCTH